VEQKAEENAGPALLAAVGSEQATAEDQQHGDSQQLSIQSAGTKKSVRFQQELLEELGTPVSATTVGGKEGPFGEVIEKRRATSNPLQMLADMGLKLVSKVRKGWLVPMPGDQIYAKFFSLLMERHPAHGKRGDGWGEQAFIIPSAHRLAVPRHSRHRNGFDVDVRKQHRVNYLLIIIPLGSWTASSSICRLVRLHIQ
jgi:hypothetical protein